jgi:GAF domain-containing protein
MSDQCNALSVTITALAQMLVGDSTLEETLRRVAELANETISGSDMVSVALLVEGRPRTVASTDVTAAAIDDAQYHTGIGPAPDVFGRQRVQPVDWTDDDHRWPPLAEAAATYGILDSLSMPLVVRHGAIGALNWYSRRPGAFSADDQHIGSGFAAAAAVAVANSQAYWDYHHLSERLGRALQSRATIEQAKGILMAEQHCDADQAFELLVGASHRQNRKLRDIADRVVKHGWRAIETVRDHPSAWLTELTNPDPRPAIASQAHGLAPDRRSGPRCPGGLLVGLPARRTAPSGPLRSG